MARKIRIEYAGAFYHVINRGNYRSGIFRTEGARGSFLECLQLVCRAQGWRLHAWCLMGNHYHLLIETPKTNLVVGMKWLQSTFANRFNRFRKANGHVFQGRYQAILLEQEAVGAVCHYIHLNPLRARLVVSDRIQDFRDSSLHQLMHPAKRWAFVDYTTCLRAAGGFADRPKGRQGYREFLLRLHSEPSEQEELGFASMTRGWAMGSQEFKQDALDRCQQQRLSGIVEAEASEMKEARWEHGLKFALRILEKQDADLAAEAKSAPWKICLARYLRERFLAPYRWLAPRLCAGEVSSLQSVVSRHRRTRSKDPLWIRLKNHEYLD